MKQPIVIILGIIAVVVIGVLVSQTNVTTQVEQEAMHDTMTQNEPKITPITHASTLLEWGGNALYVDPAQGTYEGRSSADIVLLTDIHGDHLQPEILAQVSTSDTIVVAPQAVVDQLPEDVKGTIVILANGETTEQLGFSIEAVPMYNLPESDEAYHVKGRGNGYVIEREHIRVYVAGDTGPIDEMRAMQSIDIAFVPMNLPYTMTVEDAASAVLDFAPKQVYPYHYRGSDVEQFKTLVDAGEKDIEVVLLEWYPQ